MLLTRQYIDKAFWKKLIAIGVPVSLQSMLFSLLGAIEILRSRVRPCEENRLVVYV